MPKCHREINRRITIGKEAFSKRRKLLTSKLASKVCVDRTDKNTDMERTMYGSKKCTTRNDDIKNLRPSEI